MLQRESVRIGGGGNVKDWIQVLAPSATVEYWDPVTRELQVRMTGGTVASNPWAAFLGTTSFAMIVP